MDDPIKCDQPLMLYSIRTVAGSCEVEGHCIHQASGEGACIQRDGQTVAIVWPSGSFVVQQGPAGRVNKC